MVDFHFFVPDFSFLFAPVIIDLYSLLQAIHLFMEFCLDWISG